MWAEVGFKFGCVFIGKKSSNLKHFQIHRVSIYCIFDNWILSFFVQNSLLCTLIRNFSKLDFVGFVNSLRFLIRWKTTEKEYFCTNWNMMKIFACILHQVQYFPANDQNMLKLRIFCIWRNLISRMKVVDCQNLLSCKSQIYSVRFQLKVFFKFHISQLCLKKFSTPPKNGPFCGWHFCVRVVRGCF